MSRITVLFVIRETKHYPYYIFSRRTFLLASLVPSVYAPQIIFLTDFFFLVVSEKREYLVCKTARKKKYIFKKITTK